MENKCAEAILRYDMLKAGDTAIAGVSGGADSMALLAVLCALRERLDITVSACHVNHNLRGAESKRDEQFVRDFCEGRNIPLRVFSIDVSGTRQKHESLEECARRGRYRCFEELLGENERARLATAHTASDNAETVLLNMIRGTGTKGLCGIPPVRGRIIRPLLRCTREETEGYCKENGIGFVTDSTNYSEDYARNRIRLNIIPALKEFNPSFIAGISRMTEAVSEDSAFLDKAANAAISACAAGDGYSCAHLGELDNAVLSRAVSIILSENGVSPSSLRINGCIALIRGGKGKINLCMNKFAAVKKGIFSVRTIAQNYRNRNT